MPLWQRKDAVRDRAREIAGILVRYGFSFLIKDFGLHRFYTISARDRTMKLKSEEMRALAQTLPYMLEEMGPTFIKLGQTLSSRADLVPKFVIDALERLHEHVTPIAYPEIEKLIKQSLPDYQAAIKWIEPKPLGVGSIAQTHVAELVDGRKIVIKVRKPGVINLIELDLKVMHTVVEFLTQQPEIEKLIDLEKTFAVFAHSLMKETDFSIEAGNMDLFRDLLSASGIAQIPKVEWTLTNDDILAMEFVSGLSIEQVAKNKNVELRKSLAVKFLASFLQQVLLYGVFHGDPHAGNIRMSESGEVVYLDFGIVGWIDQRTAEQLIDCFMALQNMNVAAMMNVAMEMGHSTGPINWQNYYEDMAELMFISQGMVKRRIEVGKIIHGMMQISQRHNIRMPDRLVMLGRAFALVEGNAWKMYPEINFMEVARPVFKMFINKQMMPSMDEAAIFANLLDAKKKLRIIFGELPNFISGLTKGEKQIPLEIKSLTLLIDKLDKSVNRISYSLIVASLFLTSAVMMHSGAGPMQASIHSTGFYLLFISIGASIYIYFKIFRQVKK